MGPCCKKAEYILETFDTKSIHQKAVGGRVVQLHPPPPAESTFEGRGMHTKERGTNMCHMTTKSQTTPSKILWPEMREGGEESHTSSPQSSMILMSPSDSVSQFGNLAILLSLEDHSSSALPKLEVTVILGHGTLRSIVRNSVISCPRQPPYNKHFQLCDLSQMWRGERKHQ